MTLLDLFDEQITNDKEPTTNDKSQLTNDRISAEWTEYIAQLTEIQSEIKQREFELAATNERINQLNGTIPLISERTYALKKLLGDKLVSRTQWLEIEEDRIEQIKERDVQKQIRSISGNLAQLGDMLLKFDEKMKSFYEIIHLYFKKDEILNRRIDDIVKIMKGQRNP